MVPSARAQQRQSRLGGEEGRAQIDVEMQIPMGVVGRLDRPLDIDRGIVDQDIQPAEGRGGLGDGQRRALDQARSAGAAQSRGPPPSRAMAASTLAAVRSLSATEAPASCRARAMAKPRPRAAPVTSATSTAEIETAHPR